MLAICFDRMADFLSGLPCGRLRASQYEIVNKARGNKNNRSSEVSVVSLGQALGVTCHDRCASLLGCLDCLGLQGGSRHAGRGITIRELRGRGQNQFPGGELVLSVTVIKIFLISSVGR